MKCLCEVAVGPGGHSGLIPHPRVWSIEARQTGSPWGSAVPEAAQPQPLLRSWHAPPPYIPPDTGSAGAGDDSDLGNSVRGGGACISDVARA